MINIAEILKEKSKTENIIRLNCDLLHFGTVKFTCINDDDSISLETPWETEIIVDRYGRIYNHDSAGCIIWPMGSRDWEGYSRSCEKFAKMPEIDLASLADYQLSSLKEKIDHILIKRAEDSQADREELINTFTKTLKPGQILKYNVVRPSHNITYVKIKKVNKLDDCVDVMALDINTNTKRLDLYSESETFEDLAFCFDTIPNEEEIKQLFIMAEERNESIKSLNSQLWSKCENIKF